MKPFTKEDSKRLEIVTRLYHEEIPLDVLEKFLIKNIKDKQYKEFRQMVFAEAMKENEASR